MRVLLRMNSRLLLNPERFEENPGGSIDIWWRGRRNGSLMLTKIVTVNGEADATSATDGTYQFLVTQVVPEPER